MSQVKGSIKAMVLAAGRGQRMRPLTDNTPKPLLPVNGQPLITWHLQRLAAAGITDIVINHAWLGQQIVDQLGNGSALGVNITYSAESPALETAGGIARALPLLGPDPFVVINSDIWCDWPMPKALQLASELREHDAKAHLILVDNPSHHTQGDFYLDSQGTVFDDKALEIKRLKDKVQRGNIHQDNLARLTFAGIGVYDPMLFKSVDPDQPAALAPILRQAMGAGEVRGEHHQGQWLDIGTPERLSELTRRLAQA